MKTKEEILRAMKELSEPERLEIIHNFCMSCGSYGPKCMCWRDE